MLLLEVLALFTMGTRLSDRRQLSHANVVRMSMTSSPSTFESSTSPESLSVIRSSNFLEERRPLKTALLALAARTNRGEIANSAEKEKAFDLVDQLEQLNPTNDPVASELTLGRWELVFSNTHLFRSSPFFMAARAVCKDGEEASRFNLFCDLHRQALAFTSIGKVSQIISERRLISEFETVGAVLPGLPLTLKGTIESSADIEAKTSESMSLFMDKVRIKRGSSNLPIFKDFLDGFDGLPIRRLGQELEERFRNSYSNPRPIFRTRYVDAHMRISRDQDDNIFVYNRVL